MIVDSLVIAGENRFRRGAELDEHIAQARDRGVDGLVVAPARPLDYHLGPANDRLADAARHAGMPLARLGRVDPTDGPRAVSEAYRCLAELGCAGLFLHPGEECFPARIAHDVVDIAAQFGRPVVVACGIYALSEPLQVLELARAHPSVPIVMTSGGQLNISGLGMIDAWLALQSALNLHVMTDGEYRQDFIERLAHEFDPTRVLFSSFAPYFDAAFERRRIASARLAADARALVEGGNAARIFAIQPTQPTGERS